MILFDQIIKIGKWALRKLTVFWQNLVGWLQRAYKKIKELLRKAPEGVETSLERISNGFQNVSRNYIENKATGDWACYEYTKPVSSNEVPPAIRAKADKLAIGGEIDTTNELDTQLSYVQ